MDFRFTIERLLLRGLHYRLLFAAAIVALVSVSAGIMVVLLDPKFHDAGAAIWWSFLRLSDPGYLGDDEGAVSVTISTVVTILGYVLFLGLLVAILTQWMNTLIERVESGTTRIRFKNHVLILGWNHRTPSIVLELLETRGRALRFLAESGASRLRIVILAECVDAHMREQLRSSLGSRWDDRRVVLRSGSPLELEGLERVALRDAAAVILPGADFSTAEPGVADSEIIKTLASISLVGRQEGHSRVAVAAIHNANRSEVARRAYGGDLEVIATDRLVSRLMAQSVLQPGLWTVYWELLNLFEENAVFVRKVGEEHPDSIGQARAACADAVVIGIIPSDSRVPILNPPGDRSIRSDDSLVFIARHFADCDVSSAVARSAQVAAQTGNWSPVVSDINSVLILGWSRMVPKLLEDLFRYKPHSLKVDVVGTTPVEERELSTDSLLSASESGAVRQIECDFLDPDAAAGIGVDGYDAVLMLARERMETEAVADAATISAYLTIEPSLECVQTPHVVVELQEDENQSLFAGKGVDTIVSPMIVSYILSQVALEPELGLILQELTRSRGNKILFRTYTPENSQGDCSFGEFAEQAALRGETALGVVTNTAGVSQTQLNPGSETRWKCAEIDQVIVLGAMSPSG